MSTLFQLIIGHALADFTFQTDAMAKGKNRNRPVDPAVIPPGQKLQTVWPYWLTSHALIHAGMVGVVLGRWDLALVEFVVHWFIDFGKCENWYGIHVDQGAHVVTKFVLWLFV